LDAGASWRRAPFSTSGPVHEPCDDATQLGHLPIDADRDRQQTVALDRFDRPRGNADVEDQLALEPRLGQLGEVVDEAPGRRPADRPDRRLHVHRIGRQVVHERLLQVIQRKATP
jgi:hypothetical protein